MQFRLGELFCGAGGLAWGAINAGQDEPIINEAGERLSIRHNWANDLDAPACRSYASNIVLGGGKQDDEKINANVITVDDWCRRFADGEDPESLPTVIQGSVVDLRPDMDSLPDIDAFAFGFPCNDFSHVGERRGLEGDFGPLYEHGVYILKVKRPKFFVAENVEGLVHSNKGRTLAQICCELEEAGPGYVLTPHLYRFEWYGVPQTRTRLVIVGISREEATKGVVFQVPEPTTKDSPLTAEWALTHKPIAEDAANNKAARPTSERVRMRLESTLPGQNAWNADIPEKYALHVKNVHLSHIYRRLEPHKPSYTITGNGGGGTHGYHWSEPRALTSRERARLQSFPDDFHFHGGFDSVRKQIGMAVPPVAARQIFNAILKSFARIPYPSVPATIGENAQKRHDRLMWERPWQRESRLPALPLEEVKAVR